VLSCWKAPPFYLGLRGGIELLTQLPFQHFADRTARQFINESQCGEPLRLSQTYIDPRQHRVFVKCGSWQAYDERHRRFAPLLRLRADHGCIRNVRMRTQFRLQIAWVHVEAARNDHVLLAVE
jgi:hypothetical protein